MVVHRLGNDSSGLPPLRWGGRLRRGHLGCTRLRGASTGACQRIARTTTAVAPWHRGPLEAVCRLVKARLHEGTKPPQAVFGGQLHGRVGDRALVGVRPVRRRPPAPGTPRRHHDAAHRVGRETKAIRCVMAGVREVHKRLPEEFGQSPIIHIGFSAVVPRVYRRIGPSQMRTRSESAYPAGI